MKLNKHHREEIVSRALADKRKELKTLRNKEPVMFKKAYNALFDRNVRRKLKGLGKEWFRTDYDMNVYHKGMSIHLKNFTGTLNWSERDKYKVPLPEGKRHYQLNNETGEKIFNWYKSIEKKKEEIKDAERKLNGLLNSVTTSNKLRKVWPEGRNFYKEVLEEDVVSNVPAIQINEINKSLGLKCSK